MKIKSFDSLYNSYSLDDKMRLLTDANNNVETNQYLVLATTSNMEYDTRNLRRHQIEWHRKFALSFACLIFLFIGAPLGAIIRKGGLGLPTVISTLLFIVYYIISLMGQKFVEEGLMTAFQGMWLSSFVLVIAGIFLTYQATNDSAILSLDTYMNWVREKAGLRKGQLLDNKAHILGKFELIEISRKDLQKGFADISNQAYNCIESLPLDAGWLNLSKKSFENKGISYLVEFGIHYNSFIDLVILSKWFRVPYFQKRVIEFPMLSGRITSHIFTKKFLRWTAVIVFPVALIRIIHLKIKIHRMRRNLRQVIDLSAGMINLLNSSAINIEADTV